MWLRTNRRRYKIIKYKDIIGMATAANKRVSGFSASHLRPNPSLLLRTSDTRQMFCKPKLEVSKWLKYLDMEKMP